MLIADQDTDVWAWWMSRERVLARCSIMLEVLLGKV